MRAGSGSRMKFEEVEIKFMVQSHEGLESRLRNLGAVLKHSRVHERNLRFDRPDRELTRTYQVLRLRQDEKSWLTYKGPADMSLPVSSREEIEFEVSDHEAARRFLLALGYEVSVMYEKYRTTYSYAESEIMLDELPFGYFVEIEAATPRRIRDIALKLGLRWEARILEGYLTIFTRYCQKKECPSQNLAFDEFSGRHVTAKDLDVSYAD